MSKVAIKLKEKFGKVSNIRADKGSIKFDKHDLRNGKEVRVQMSVLIDQFT